MISKELGKYSDTLLAKERWLVLNKIDLLPSESVVQICDDMVKRLNWKGKVFAVSGLSKQGLDTLAKAAMAYLQMHKEGKEKEDWEE